MLFSAPAGNDLLYDEDLVKRGRNFANKIWNAFRLVKGWDVADIPQPEENKVAITWFQSRLNQALGEIENHFSKFRISDALQSCEKLIWDDFCSWYLEMIKPEFEKPIDRNTYHSSISYFEILLKTLHPFMPFITEELWHELNDRRELECIIVADYPKSGSFNEALVQESLLAFEIITEVRNTRNAKGISPRDSLELHVKEVNTKINVFWPVIRKLANLADVKFVAEAPSESTSRFLIRSSEFFIPLAGQLDVEKEGESIRRDLEYQKGFLISVEKKLSNEKFMAGAPAQVVEIARRKKADAEAKIKAIEDSLSLM